MNNNTSCAAQQETTLRIHRARALVIGVLVLLTVLFAVGFAVIDYINRPVYTYSPNTKVLLYHLIEDKIYGKNDYLFVRVADFEAQLAEIQNAGLPSAFSDELENYNDTPCVVLTFDDGYDSTYYNAFPLLKKYNIKATVFLITEQIGHDNHLTKAQIREMEESGLVHFGSHTVSHPTLSKLSTVDAYREFKNSKKALDQIVRHSVKSVAYPGGVYNETILHLAEDAGYTYGFTTEMPVKNYYENTRLPRYYVVRDMSLSDFSKLLK